MALTCGQRHKHGAPQRKHANASADGDGRAKGRKGGRKRAGR